MLLVVLFSIIDVCGLIGLVSVLEMYTNLHRLVWK